MVTAEMTFAGDCVCVCGFKHDLQVPERLIYPLSSCMAVFGLSRCPSEEQVSVRHIFPTVIKLRRYHTPR